MFKIVSVVGARPNFMKIAALCEAINDFNKGHKTVQHVLVHTGQHYDANMSDSFFNDLNLPTPDMFLGVGSGSHSVQTARIMERFENIVLTARPHVVLVVGDVNSTLACALVAKKIVCPALAGEGELAPKLAHVEAGLRSFDRTMPEEINRVVTDALSDYLFTTEESANENLIREGIARDKIHFVGNVMIDTLLRHRSKAEQSTILSDLELPRNGTKAEPFAVLTLHRPGNVDDKTALCKLLKTFVEIAQDIRIIFPAHPRTLRRITEWTLGEFFVDQISESRQPENGPRGIRLIPPLGYLDFLQLVSHARVILTDSGGIQEEATILGVPCLTLRDNTERPVTITQGTNVLVGAADPRRLVEEFKKVLNGELETPTCPPYWDGHAAQRIVKILVDDHPTSGQLPSACSEPPFKRDGTQHLV